MISATLKKLRYREGARVCVIGAPAAFEAELARADELERTDKLGKDLDLVQVFMTRLSQVERERTKLKAALAPKGILWICYPKARGLGSDLNRDIVRESVAEAGLETVAIAAIDDVWSALRCKRVDGDEKPAAPAKKKPARTASAAKKKTAAAKSKRG